MAQQDDNIKKLYDELQSTYDVGSEDDFRNYLNNAEHRKALYNELKNDYDIQDEKAFDDYLGYINGEKAPGTTKVGSVAQQVVNEYDQSAKDNAEAEEDLSAATSGAKIGGNISFAPAKPNNQQTVQLDVDNTAKSVMDASGTPAEQAKVTGPKTQFVPADPNYVQATPTAEALKKYPWMQPDQVYLWNKTTKEPVVTYVDESGQAVTDEDLQIKKSKSEITGQEDTEYMHPEAAALQLPNGNTRGVRLKKGALTQMADEIMRKEYGDNYLNTQFGKDGNVYTGAERRDLGAQQLYDELNSDVRNARISFAVADEKDRNEILSRIKAKWGKVADETSLVNAVSDENAAKEDIDIVAQQNINDLNAEIQNISRQMDQRGAEIDNASSPFVDQTFNARDVDAKYRLLQSKLNYAQNALKSWENVKNSGSLDALAGFKDAVMDISAWDFGFSDLKNAVSLLTAKGKDKQELVNLYGRSAEAAKFEDKYNPDSYRYGKIAGTSIPYALQFAGTDGGFKSIGSALSKKATSIAEKYALEGLKKQVVKGLGVAVGDIARAYTMSGTVQGLNTISDILTRSAGELTVDKQGNYQLKSDEPLLESIYKGVTASAIQNFTEMVGESVNISANLMRMLPKIGLGRVSNAITKIGTQDWYRVCNNWLSRAGVNDFGGEVLEEELSIILNAAFVGDNPLLNGSGGLLDVRTQKDILGGMLYSISAMRAGALAMYGVKKGVGSAFVKTLDMYDKMQLNQSDKGGQSIFGEGWTEIKDEIDNTPNDKVNAVIEKLAKEHPSKDEQSAIIDYAVKLLKTRGHNLGIAMASDGENDEGAQEEVQDMPDLSQPNAEYFNKDDGMIHKASLYPDASDPTGTAKDVFIIKGNLVTNEDGSINKDASDDTIIYIDGNGERHIASPDKFAAAYPPMSNNEVLQANEGGENEEAQTTTFNKGDEVNINVDGNNYTATIQGTDGFGNYNVYYEDEIGMMHPAKFTADQLNEMNGKSTVSNGQQATSEQPADVQQQVEQPVVEQPAQQEQETQLAQQAQEEQKSAIPTDEKGNMLYHQVPVETTINDLYDGSLDDNEIRDFVDVNISEADKNLEKVNKKAPKIGTNKAEYLKKKQEWQKQVEDATRIRDYWNGVKDYIAQQTHTTPEEVKAAQDELSGEAARREYQDMGGSVQQDAVSVASDFIRGAKITPESFKAETGYGTDEQRKFVGMIAKAEKGGKTIDRLAEELVSYDNAEMNGVLFGGDTSSAKDAILSALQGAGTRGELRQTNEAKEQAYIDARNAARDAQYMEQYGMTYEEYLAYEEQIMPTIWREYNNYDETAFNNMYAEEIEQLIKSRENDTTGEEQADDRGNQVLSEQQVTEQRGSAGSQEPGTEIQAGVQGIDENAAAPEEAQQQAVAQKIATAEAETNIASPEKDINKDDYIYITNTYNGLQGIGNLKEWSKKTGDVRTEPDGFGVYNGLSYFKKSYGGRGGDNVTVWFKNSPSQNVRENIEYLLDNSKNLLYFGDDLVKLIVNTKDDAIINKKISLAEAETNTNPTEGQKEAGNYKKGHVRIDGYDITIEQPKGSVRRGTDADGKQWEQTMNNTYGYIRGTEGVDGDHIDIFLSDNPTEGNVYVVDQVNTDGSFDEHKVMYGFQSAEDARAAYLSNYEEGWQGLGTITEVSKEEFKKWVNSSKRKTKPFSEYKSVNAIGAQNEEREVGKVSPEILSFRQKKIDELNAVKDEDVKKGPSAWYFDKPLLVSAKTKKSAISKMHKRREDDIQSINNGSIDWMYNAIQDKGLVGYEEVSSVEEKSAEEKKPEYGANNKVVSKERYEELKKRMIKKLGQLNFGMDPELIEIGVEMTAYHLEAGARKFADYAKAMINDVGDVIRPYLKSLYNAARDYPDVVEAGLNVGMSTGDEVSKFDVTNFDKKTIDALSTADNVVKEQNIKKETEKIIKENEKKSEQTAKKSVSSQKIADLFGDINESTKSDAQRRFSDTVKSDMLSALDRGEKPYRSIVDLRKRASEVGMDVDNEGRSDILLQELVEDGLVGAAREVINKYGSDSKDSYDLICKLYDMQPTIAARSSNRIKMQQYSTPLPMAWNAAHFAMSGKQGGKVLEPTAGNGMLVFAVPANQVHANELDETRLNNLREQGFAEVTQQDATEPFEGGKQYDAIIANPPFGSREAVDYDGKMIPGLDPQITLNALSSMKDDGKAAIIIGGNMEYAKNGSIKSMKPFFTYLYDHYNVKGVVDMDGKLYAKQGTTFPTRMILIDGRRSEEERAQTTVYPPVESKAVAKVSSFEELYNTVNDIISSKEKTNGTEILHSRERELLSVNNRPSGNAERNRRPEQPRKNDTTGRGNKPEGSKEQSERVLPGERRKNTGDGETRNEVAGSEQRGSRGNNEPAIQRVGGERVLTERVGLKEEPKKRSLTEEKLPYRPHNTAFSLNSVAPSAMVEAMDKILTQIEKENGSIDEFVRKELGYDTIEEAHQALAAEQMDSVAMAIYQMKRGQALIIGDQTGVGKGRQMAALIRWAVKRGEKPIFITQKADLFSDIYRDLVDVGSGDLVPFIFNSDGAMVDSNGNVVHKPLSASAMSKVFASGELPDSYDFAVLTYSQVNTGDAISQKEAEEAAKKSGTRAKKSKASKEGKPTPKATFLRAIAKDNYLFLDESHTAAGSSNTGAYLQSILKSAKAATFASATFAKRPDTMPLYAIRTAMSQAKIEPEKLISIIEKGGVTLQEIMSRELTNAGQMVRRERDMSDVKTDWKTIDDPSTVKRARENYDKTIQAFNAIIKFQNDFVKPKIDDLDQSLAIVAQSAGVKKGTDKMGVENVPFASKTYNYTKQLMLALKVDAIADEVEKEIKAGRHPVIALESTMESTIKDYSAGEVIKEPTFSASLLKGLDSVMQYTIKDEDGKETHARYAPSDLGKAGEEAYYNLQKLIRESTSDIFISPLDAIIERLHEKGYKVGELTGRNLYVERNENGEVVVKRRTDKDKKKMQRDFNSGNLDVLILNKSASTGISLHASEKFKDQRQRTMIIAQPLSDINDYMQMIGRIDRTGQVHRGYYINLGLPVPAENRFLMMLSTKLKSLNANTTTSQDSKSNEVEAPDLLNKYGSQVVVEYLRDNPEVYEKMGAPLKKGGLGSGKVQANELDEYKPQDDDARKITGYVALLSTKEQEDFYNDVVKRYNDLIQYLNDTGSNDLKINVMPLRAKTIEKRVSSEGIDPNGTNPFAQNAYVEKVEMDVLRKPMKAEEVRKTIDKLNKTNVDVTTDVIRKESDAKIASENARYENAREKALDDIQKQKEKIEKSKKLSDEEKVSAINSYITDTNNTIEERHDKNLKKITDNRDQLIRRLRMFDAGKSYLVPDNLESMTFDFASPAIFCGYKAKENKITASTTLAVFATLDSRRRIEIKLSDINALQSIDKMTMDNIDAARAITLDNWDSQIPTETRKEGYILTGNILQAIADSQDEYGGYTGHLVSYTDIDGNIHDGILMPDKWNTSLLKSSGAPLSARMEQIKRYEPIVSSDGKVTLNGSQWAEMYYLTVPKTKKDGAMYYENKVLLDASKGEFYPYRGNLRADIPAENIEGVVKELTKLGVKVRESNDAVSRDTNINEEEANDLYREVTDERLINKLENEPKVKVYRAMQLQDGKLLPPMSGKIKTIVKDKNGKERTKWVWREPTNIGKWEEAEERPDLANDDGTFTLNKGNNSLNAAYNPYIHTSRSPINDQFSSAWNRDELVTVEVEVPVSELTSGYRAEKAKDSVGEVEWKSGPVGRQLAKIGKPRLVILSRWDKPIRVIPVDEVAGEYAKRLEGTGIEVPFNTVTPELREALVKAGVKIGAPENNNAGKASLDAYNEWRNNNEIDRQGAGALTDSELSNANDPAGKMLGKPSRTPAQQKAFAERERQRMADRAREVADILHLDNVEIVTDASTLKGRRAKAKGFYSRDNGKIVIVVPNHVDMADIEQTVLHEAVAHYGLRKLFGSNFDTFLYNVYNNADMDVRDKIVKLAEGHNWDFATATEEYLASLAEKTNFENLNASWWDKIKSLFLKLLHSIGLKGFTGVSLSDNELRYILWRSYENLKNPGRYRSIIDEAKDITMQNELRVGNYSAGNSEAVGKAAENGVVNIEDVNRRFNEELGRLTEENAQSVILNLGRPGNFLLASGLSDRPIKLYGNKLLKKMRKHGFTTSDVKNLPKEINNPIAVFKGSVENSFAILTELEINGNNVLASISVGKGNDIDFNIISSVYGKNGNSVVSWINDGKILYVNKEKALNYLRISAPIAEAQDNQELSSAANIVKNFENPSVGEENILYREAKKVEKKINSDWRDEYDKKLSKFSFKLTEAAQDAMRSVKILQDIIAKETSAPIRDDENVYWRENRLSSVNKYEQEYYNENYCKPIVTEIANLVKYGARYNDKGEDIINSDNDVLKYLIAKSGLERNQSKREVEAMNARKPYEDQIKELQKQVEKEEIKEENANKKIAKLQEQADKAEMNKRVAVLHKDYSGLTELFQDEKDFDTLATSYVSDFEKKFDTESLWNAINRATKETLRKAFVDGLISRESYESTAKMYKYYIPLRGWANDVASEAYNYKGSGEGSRKILQTAKGRTSLADNPISEIGRMMQDAIFQGNRNRMKQAVYNLAMNHDTSLLNIKRQWYQNMGTEEDPAWERVFPDLNSDMTADQVAEEVEDFESRMRELKKEGKATQSRKGLILRLHTTKREEAQHRISVAINGKEYNIFVNGNPRAAQAINGELNDVDRYGSAVAKVNRFLSQVYTSINPEFVVTNYQRDAGFAASIVASTEPWSYQKEWAKNMTIYNPITTGAYLSSLIKKAKTGNINPNNKAERYMQEFLSNGGETGFTNMLSADDYKKQIKRDIKSINSVVSLPKASRAAVAFTERANTVFEDATRYATYVTSREQGRTIDRSIRDAKEISLNFNTRGADGLPGDGFIYRFFRGLRRWMIFVNPSIQGLNKAGMAFRNHPLRSSMMIAGLPTLLGYALPAIMRAVVGGGDGDDDDKNVVESYKDLPKWVRRTNIAIPIGGNNFVTIPLSYELRVSYGLGEMMWEYGEGMIDKDEVATETVSQLSDLLPISFSNGTVAQSISPSIARPLIDIIQNRNFYGKKIYNDSQFIEGYPEYMKAYAGTPKWLVKSTEVLNNVIPNLNAGVSDKYTPGVINVNPAIIDYLLSSYLGGLYNFPSKFGKTISMIWDEDMRDIQNVPILSRNWKNSQSGNPYNSGDRYKTYMKEYDLSKQRFNGYKKEAKNDVPEFLNSLKDLLNTPSGKRMLMIDAYKRGGLDKLNQRIRDIDAYDNERYEGEKDALTKKRDEVKEELINKLDSISDGTLDFVNGEWVRK